MLGLILFRNMAMNVINQTYPPLLDPEEPGYIASVVVIGSQSLRDAPSYVKEHETILREHALQMTKGEPIRIERRSHPDPILRGLDFYLVAFRA
jgi:hypothetical protein